jgi:hypothetical protein
MGASNFFRNFRPLFQNQPSKGTQTKAIKTRATKSQDNLDKFLRSLETQRKRQNSNRRPNGRETDKIAQDRELRTVHCSTLDSPLQYPRLSVVQKSETELREIGSVLGLKLGPGLSVVQSPENTRKAHNSDPESWTVRGSLADCP